MGLTLVAIPIGHPRDLSLRALDVLQSADLVIGEERSEASKFLKQLQLLPKEIRLLNEHSKNEDVEELSELCKAQSVALISDCGTPGFCDPGARLVAICRKKEIAVTAVPGASSLMMLLSLCGLEVKQFLFLGFLPADKILRQKELSRLKDTPIAVVLMDTPYRLSRLLADLVQHQPKRPITIGLDLTNAAEEVLEGLPAEILSKLDGQKREFLLILHPQIKLEKVAVPKPVEKRKDFWRKKIQQRR